MASVTHSLEQHTIGCIQTCMDCARFCNACADEMVGMPHDETNDSIIRCIRLCRDCADICLLAAQWMGRNSAFSIRLCALCAEVCELCAGLCEQQTPQHAPCGECAKNVVNARRSVTKWLRKPSRGIYRHCLSSLVVTIEGRPIMRRHDLAILVLGTAFARRMDRRARRRCRYPFPQPDPGSDRPAETIGPDAPFLPRDRRLSRATGAPIVRSSSDRRSEWTCIGDSIRLAGGHESRAADRSAHHRPGHNGVVYHSNPDLFRNLSIGERLTLKLDSAQRAIVCWRKSVRNCPPQAPGITSPHIEMPKCPALS